MIWLWISIFLMIGIVVGILGLSLWKSTKNDK